MRLFDRSNKTVGDVLTISREGYSGDSFKPNEKVVVIGFSECNTEEVYWDFILRGEFFAKGERVRTQRYLVRSLETDVECCVWPEETLEGHIKPLWIPPTETVKNFSKETV